MELVSKMKNFLRTLSLIFVSYIYKWILPLLTTILMIFFANQERNILIRLVLWILLCVEYQTIPFNFERPKKEAFSFLLKKTLISRLIIFAQSLILSLSVFILTALSVKIYFPKIEQFHIEIALFNSLLYFGIMLLEYWLLPDKVKNDV
jgi:hypothetical protein